MKTKTTIPRAADLMTRKVETVTADLSLAELVDFLLKNELSNAPVVEQQGKQKFLLGFVSESDALEHMTNEMFYGRPESQQTVATCMKRHPVSISEDADAVAIASVLVNHRFRHLPVVDENNHLRGIVSRRDVLRAIRDFHVATDQESDASHFRPDLKKIINHRFIFSR